MRLGKQPLVWLSALFHLISFALSGYILWVIAYTPAAPDGLFARLATALAGGRQARPDGIAQAAELGRLDVISIALTLLGVVLAIAALSSFFFLRHAVIETAREEVEKVDWNKHLTPEVLAVAIKSDPVLLAKLQSLVTEDLISSKAAQDISEVIDDGYLPDQK